MSVSVSVGFNTDTTDRGDTVGVGVGAKIH